MGPILLGIAVAVIVLAVPFASRRLRPGRPGHRGAVQAAAPPAFPAAGGAAPRPEPQPSGDMSGPFAYDNGLITGDRP